MTEMEKAVLAAAMIMPKTISSVAERLGPADFSTASGKAVYEAILEIDEAGAVDPLLVIAHLEEAGHKDARESVASIVETAPTTAHAAAYADEVHLAAIRRGAVNDLSDLAAQAKRPDSDIVKLLSAAEDRTAALSSRLPGARPPEAETDPIGEMMAEFDEQMDEARVILDLPWPRLSGESRAMRPGTMCLLGGPPGTGKSFFCAHIAMAVHRQGAPWRYLPLEGRRMDMHMRFLGILENDYRMVDDDRDNAPMRKERLVQHAGELVPLVEHVAENPRMGCRDARGRTIVPPVTDADVMAWVQDAISSGARVVFVDPVSQIEFQGRYTWNAEAAFVRRLLALAADSRATIFLIAHTVKRPGAAAKEPLSLDDLQGSAMFGRLCQTAIMLDAHDFRESVVFRAGGATEAVSHNRTLLIAKSRFGGGTRRRVAFTQHLDQPEFTEHGMIAPKGAQGGPL